MSIFPRSIYSRQGKQRNSGVMQKSLSAILLSVILQNGACGAPSIIPYERPSCLSKGIENTKQPANKEALASFNRGKDNFLAANFDAAIDEFSKAIKLDANFAQAFLARGFARIWGKDDRKGGLSDYAEAIKIDNKNAETYWWRGEAVRESSGYGTELYKSAAQDFTRAIELQPDYVEAYRRRAWVKEGIKDLKGAIADQSQVIKLKPTEARAYIERAKVEEKAGDNNAALKDYGEVTKLGATDAANGFYERARLLVKMGNNKDAIGDFTKAIDLTKSGENANTALAAYEERARAREATGDNAGAKKDRADAKELKARTPEIPH